VRLKRTEDEVFAARKEKSNEDKIGEETSGPRREIKKREEGKNERERIKATALTGPGRME